MDVVVWSQTSGTMNENEPKFLRGRRRRLLPGVIVGRLLRLFLPVPRGRVAPIRGSLRRWSLRRRPPPGPVGLSAQTAALCARLLGTPSARPAISRGIRINGGKRSTIGTVPLVLCFFWDPASSSSASGGKRSSRGTGR
jgi:hypothetical protein